MPDTKQEPGAIDVRDVLAQSRNELRNKPEGDGVKAAQKRSRTVAEESDGEMEVIASRRVKRPRSRLRRTSQGAGECQLGGIAATQGNNDPSRTSNGGDCSISPGSSERPKTRSTENGAILYICEHPGCEKACRTLKALKSHSEDVHSPVGSPEQRCPVPKVIYVSGTVIQVDEARPDVHVQKPRSEEKSAQRPKPQPSRWRRRQNHPLLQSPDPSNLTISERTKELRQELIPPDPTTPAPQPTYRGFSKIGKAYQPACVRLSEPQKCPVVVCGKRFEYVKEFKCHKENGHRGQRLATSGDGCFHLINPKTNQPCNNPNIRSFVCEDCGACFKGETGLDFHKSRSAKCTTPSTTHPALLKYGPTEASTDDTLSRVEPLVFVFSEKTLYPETATPTQIKDVSQDKTPEETTLLEQSKSTPMQESRDASVKEFSVCESRNSARLEEVHNKTPQDTEITDRQESANLEESQGAPVQAADRVERRKSVRLNPPPENVQRVSANACGKEANDLGGPSLEDPGVSSELSDAEVPLGTQRAQTCKVHRGQQSRQRLPPDPDSWEEATDADRKLVVQGQANTKWKVLQQSWHKSTGIQTSIAALQLRYYRLLCIIGEEAKRHSHSYIDSEGESESEPEHVPTRASTYANVRVTRGARVVPRKSSLPLSWDQASKADKRLVAMKEKGHKWRTIIEAYSTTVGRHMNEKWIKKRFDRLVQVREGVVPYPKELISNSGAYGPTEKDEHRGQTKEDHKVDSDEADSSDNCLIDEISDDSSEDEGLISVLKGRRKDGNTNKERGLVDRPLEEHTTEGQGTLPSTKGHPIDPERMLVALKAGENRWPSIREDWEIAAGRTTATNGIAKQSLELFNDADMSLLLAAEAVVEARFARTKYAMIADIMRANGAKEHIAAFVENELQRICKSATLSTYSRK